jgi:hypothetical protein
LKQTKIKLVAYCRRGLINTTVATALNGRNNSTVATALNGRNNSTVCLYFIFCIVFILLKLKCLFMITLMLITYVHRNCFLGQSGYHSHAQNTNKDMVNYEFLFVFSISFILMLMHLLIQSNLIFNIIFNFFSVYREFVTAFSTRSSWR